MHLSIATRSFKESVHVKFLIFNMINQLFCKKTFTCFINPILVGWGKNYPPLLDKNGCSKKLQETVSLPQFFIEQKLVFNIS